MVRCPLTKTHLLPAHLLCRCPSVKFRVHSSSLTLASPIMYVTVPIPQIIHPCRLTTTSQLVHLRVSWRSHARYNLAPICIHSSKLRQASHSKYPVWSISPNELFYNSHLHNDWYWWESPIRWPSISHVAPLELLLTCLNFFLYTLCLVCQTCTRVFPCYSMTSYPALNVQLFFVGEL